MIKHLKALLWNERMIFKPFFIFMAIIFLGGIIFESCTEYLEDISIWDFVSQSEMWVYFLFMYIGSLGLYTKEHDTGTQFFLKGLPLSQRLAYTVKSIMPTAILTVFFLLDFVLSIVIDLITNGISVTAKDFQYIVPMLITGISFLIICGAILGVLSFLRHWGLILLALCVNIAIILMPQECPYINYFNIFSLCDAPLNQGDEWLIPWKHIGLLLGASAVLWLIGMQLYCVPYGHFDTLMRRYKSSVLVKIVPLCFVFTLIVNIVLFAVSQDTSDTLTAEVTDKLPERSSEQKVIQKRSDHFVWTLLSKHEARYEELTEDCENAHEHISTFLKVPEESAQSEIQVDACNPLSRHAAGVAHWKKLRLNLELHEDNKGVLSVFGHELTHVFISLTVKQRLFDTGNFPYSRWFHEGLASYIEKRFYGDPGDYHAHLALAASWDEVHFDELFSDAELAREGDINLVYPAGMLWFEALVEAYGDDAPAKLLKVLSENDAYDRIRGINTWRSICQDAGVNLEMVRNHFNKRLEELVEEHEEFCSTYPEITQVEVEQTTPDLILRPELPSNWDELKENGTKLVIKTTLDHQKTSSTLTHTLLNKDDDKFHIRDAALTKDELYFQIGYSTPTSEQGIYGEWSKVNINE